MKKLIAILVAISLAFFVMTTITGCGTDGNEPIKKYEDKLDDGNPSNPNP